jgi:hypothetical protein
MLRGLLAAEGCKVGRRHVKTLMRRMGIEVLYRRPRTTTAEPGHKVYPYLLRGMEIRPNQVWAMDITYIPMARGFVYLAVVLDWFSRCVLSWRLSITWRRPSAWRRWRMPWPATAPCPRFAMHPLRPVSASHTRIDLPSQSTPAATGRKQAPFVYGSLPGEDFFFVAGK